jgi:hypothetical protein
MCRFHEDVANATAAVAPKGLSPIEVQAVAQVALTQDRVQMRIPALRGIVGNNPLEVVTPEVQRQFQSSGLPKKIEGIEDFNRQAIPVLAATIANVFSDHGIASGSLGLPGCPNARTRFLDDAANVFFDGDTSKSLTIKRTAPEPRFVRLFEPVKALLSDEGTRDLLHGLFDASVAKIVIGAPAELAAMRKGGIDPNAIGSCCHMGAPATPKL